jgi:hypothetical protein
VDRALGRGDRRRWITDRTPVTSFRASAGETQWCCFLATASERRRPSDTQRDPVHDLLEQETRLVTERLHQLAVEADLEDASTVASHLVLIYNGALSSLLRSVPADPLAHARRLAEMVVESSAPVTIRDRFDRSQ